MIQHWSEVKDKAVTALLGAGDPAVTFFTRRDLLGEDLGHVSRVWDQPEPKKLLRQQREDGSWKGPPSKKPVYPDAHADLVASFKAFRMLVERFGMNRENRQIETAAEYLLGFQTDEGDIRGFIANQYAT